MKGTITLSLWTHKHSFQFPEQIGDELQHQMQYQADISSCVALVRVNGALLPANCGTRSSAIRLDQFMMASVRMAGAPISTRLAACELNQL